MAECYDTGGTFYGPIMSKQVLQLAKYLHDVCTRSTMLLLSPQRQILQMFFNHKLQP